MMITKISCRGECTQTNSFIIDTKIELLEAVKTMKEFYEIKINEKDILPDIPCVLQHMTLPFFSLIVAI